MIYHIYWGTSGNSGLYLDEIYQCLKSNRYEQKVFVSYYYPFDYGEKIFFRKSDMAHCRVKGAARKMLQLYEIISAFIKILLAARKDKPHIINYSLISGSYSIVIIFLKMIKTISRCKLVITCHDVCPWGGHSSESPEMINRKKIFQLADCLLVHNENSIKELQQVFGVERNKIIKHLFPIMDLSKIQVVKSVDKQCDFLFIGHLRKDKGIDFLINTWPLFHKQYPEATLWVCGRPQGQQYDIAEMKRQNITCNLGYISEDDYCRYIQSARYVILPYLKGTNSGIISTVLSLGANVIASDIPMFQENPMVDNDNMFTAGNQESLLAMLCSKYLVSEDKDTKAVLSSYRKRFKEETVAAYNQLC